LFPDFRACTTSSMALLHAASSLPAARNCFPIFGVLATEAHTGLQAPGASGSSPVQL
jgi:hypothetical protein